jgi:hypothetical protein
MPVSKNTTGMTPEVLRRLAAAAQRDEWDEIIERANRGGPGSSPENPLWYRGNGFGAARRSAIDRRSR